MAKQLRMQHSYAQLGLLFDPVTCCVGSLWWYRLLQEMESEGSVSGGIPRRRVVKLARTLGIHTPGWNSRYRALTSVSRGVLGCCVDVNAKYPFLYPQSSILGLDGDRAGIYKSA